MTAKTVTAHTPGPWKVATVYVNNAPNELHVTTGVWGEPSVAVVGYTETDRANARLIAAAPELLEALKCLRAVGTLGECCSPSSSRQMADAAIAKAEGRS